MSDAFFGLITRVPRPGPAFLLPVSTSRRKYFGAGARLAATEKLTSWEQPAWTWS